MKCPIDGSTLSIADRSGIEVDYCPDCRGVWLDRGELDKLIDRVALPPAPGQRSSPRRDDDDDDERRVRDQDDDRDRYRSDDQEPVGSRRRKRGGLLGEIFDFD